MERLGEETRAVAVIVAVVNGALAADDELAAFGELAGLFELRGFFGFFAAFIPREFHGREVAARGELIFDDRGFRERDRALAGDFLELDARGRAEVEVPIRGVHEMARHVAEGAATVVLVTAPFEGMDRAAEGAFLGATEEQVLREARRGRLGRGPFLHALGPDDTGRSGGTVGPDLHFTHIAEHAGLEPLAHEADAFARVTLITHLGAHAIEAGEAE